MNDNGYVLAYRRVWRHPVFRDLLDAAVWNYLYQNAAWQDSAVTVNGHTVPLTRGQIFVTYRSLAGGFCCNEKRIRRLTDGLAAAAMIAALPTHRGVLITICNYDEYQRPQADLDAAPPQPPPRPRRTDGRASNKDELNPMKEGTRYAPEFEAFWGVYPRNNGSKKDAAGAYHRATTKGFDHATILDGAARYAAYIAGRADGSRYTKHASTWLNGQFWESAWDVPNPNPAGPRREPPKSKFQLAVEATERARAARESGGPGPA